MLELVDVGPRHLKAYRDVAPDALLAELEGAAARLRGARVLHVSATPCGGGVSELLRSIVPLVNDLGIVAHWKIIRGDERFFEVVAGRAGGIPLQMAAGTGGIRVDTVEECANATLSLLNDRDRARRLGQMGHERVKQQFLVPRLVLDELDLLGSLEGSWAPAPPAERFASRDPVCGMALDLKQLHPERVVDGTVFHFCSEQCQRQFSRHPHHYLGAGSGG